MPSISYIFSRLSAFFLTGCFIVGSGSAEPIAEKDLPKNKLTGETLFQIIASEFALQRNDPSTAYQTYMEVARKTKDPRLAQRAFQIADAAHAFHEAKAASDLWVDFSPNGYEEANFSSLLARLRTGDLSDNNKKEAIRLLNKQKSRQEREMKFESIAIQAELGTNDAKKVLDFVIPLATTCENKGLAALMLGKLYRRAGDRSQSLHYSKIAYTDLPNSSSAALEYADALIQTQQAQAVKVLENFVSKHPENLDVQLGLAKAYARTRNSEGVKKQLPILDPYSKRSAALSFSLATIADAVALDSETKRFLMQFERLAIEHSTMIDRLPQTYFSLGLLDFRKKHYSAAIEWFNKVDSQSEFFARARVLQARSLERNGEFKKAIDLLEDTKVNPNIKAEILLEQSQIYYNQKDLSNAYKKIKKALELTPNNPGIIAQTALLASDLGENEHAIELLREGINKFPKRADFYNTLGYLLINNNQNLEEAGQLLNKAIELEPNNYAIQDSLGWYYFKVQNYELAKRYLEEAAKNNSDNEILMHLAELYYVTKNQSGFDEIIEKIRQSKDHSEEVLKFFKRFDLTY